MNQAPAAKKSYAIFLLLCIVVLAWQSANAGVGQSAVITLVFPPGARATGLGEAFTGLSNDANAIFYNPAGLGQGPLANTWKAYTPVQGPITSIAAKKQTELMSSDLIWAGTPDGVIRYQGKTWEEYDIYLVEQNDNLKSIAQRYLNIDDEKVLADAVMRIRTINGIEMKRSRLLTEKLKQNLRDSLLQKNNTSIDVIANQIMSLPVVDRTPAKIYGIIVPLTDSTTADKLSDVLAAGVKIKDIELPDLVELKIPFTIAVHDTVTALAMDDLNRLWVGTRHGLYRTAESKWTRFTVVDGLPSNVITSIAAGSYGSLCVGTDNGIGQYKDGRWLTIGTKDGLPESKISSVTFGPQDVLYAGTSKGLVRKKDSVITVFDSSKGLLSTAVTSLYLDSKSRLWIGGSNGVTVYTEKAWKRYKISGSTVECVGEQKNGTMWIGTNQGAVSFRDGGFITTKDGRTVEKQPEWKVFHSKNALQGNEVFGITASGNDLWLTTEKGINQYQWAERQTLFLYEPLLPAFHIKELWHTFFAQVLPTEDWGTLGLSVNFINMGTNEWTNELGVELGKARSWEGVFGLSYGLSLMYDLSMGTNIKYVYSALAPGIGSHGAGTGQTYAVDVAVLKRNLFVHNLSLGFMLQNMGPSIYYIDPEKSDPIPFSLRLGTAYTAVQTPIHELTLLLDLNREIVKNYIDKQPDPFYVALWTDLLHDKDESAKYEAQQVNVNLGMEYWYSHFFAGRLGFLGDYIGERYELTFGMGLNYGNLNFDFSYIYSPEGFMKGILKQINSEKTGSSGARNGQYRASFLFKL